MPTGNIIKIGDEFTRLTVLAPAGKDRDGKTLWLCACACFNLTWARTAQLNSKSKKSCGCLVRDNAIKRNTTHGMTTRQTHPPEWTSWSHMRYRCNDPDNAAYERYGGRGIQACKRFNQSFIAFYRCVGPRPSPQHSIDRVDNNGHYSCGTCADCRKNGWPMNVRWATKKEQSQNRSVTVWIKFKDQRHCLAEWSRITGIKENTLTGRLDAGWSIENALTIPPSKGNSGLKLNQD